jgi:hypothetical protein
MRGQTDLISLRSRHQDTRACHFHLHINHTRHRVIQWDTLGTQADLCTYTNSKNRNYHRLLLQHRGILLAAANLEGKSIPSPCYIQSLTLPMQSIPHTTPSTSKCPGLCLIAYTTSHNFVCRMKPVFTLKDPTSSKLTGCTAPHHI